MLSTNAASFYNIRQTIDIPYMLGQAEKMSQVPSLTCGPWSNVIKTLQPCHNI